MNCKIEKFGDIAINSHNPLKFAARCTVFAESDFSAKTQAGYKKEDIMRGYVMQLSIII